MADLKYTHPGADSPGLHQQDPSPHADYPRVLYKDDGTTLTVGSAAEEADALEDGFHLSRATQRAIDAAKSAAGTVAAILVAIVLSLVALPVQAQTTITQTTLSAAQSAPAQGSPATTISLTSATGVVAPTATAPGTELFVDGEAELVTAISGTTASVIRGYDGTKSGAHANGATIYAGPASGVLGSPYVGSDPALGTCTASSQLYTLTINTIAGRIWTCTNSVWQLLKPAWPAQGVVYPALNTAIASAATIAPNLGVTHVTGTTAINTITVPAGCGGACQITLIPDALGSTGTSGNIALGSTFVVSKALILTWDGSKWTPSY